MKRQVLKTILFALPKVLDLTARRFPAYRDRLKERDLVAWIGLMDESIGRVITFRNGRVEVGLNLALSKHPGIKA